GLAGRVWRPDEEGRSIVAVRAEGVLDVSGAFPSMRDLCEADDPASALRAASRSVLSFPKIISGRIDDAIRTGLVWRRWLHAFGRLVVAARPCPTPSACASRCNRANTRSEFDADAVRRRSGDDLSSRAARSRSSAQQMGFARATLVISDDPECPSSGADL